MKTGIPTDSPWKPPSIEEYPPLDEELEIR